MIRMQRVFIGFVAGIFILLNGLGAFVAAQGIPQETHFQGILKDVNGSIVSDGDYDFTFKLYNQSTGGTPLWQESHFTVPVNNGLYSVTLGSVNPLDLPFDEPYWIGITVGSDSEMTPLIKLTSVPTALSSKNAESAESLQGQPVSATGPGNGEVLQWNGFEWAASPIAAVATTGSYNDLLNTPALATVATSGNYSDLIGTPVLATVATSGSYNDLSGKPGLSTVATTGNYDDLIGTPNLATVATSGSYYDLINKPAIPDASNFVTIPDIQTITGTKTFLGSVTVGNSSTSRNISIYTSLAGLNLYKIGGSQFGDIRTNADNDFILRNPSGKLRTYSDLYLQYSSTSSWRDLYAGEVKLHDYLVFNTSTGQTVARMTANGSSEVRMSFDSGDHLKISGDLEVDGELNVGDAVKIWEYSSGEGALVVQKDGSTVGQLYATSTGYGYLELRRNTSNGYGVMMSGSYSGGGAGMGLYNSSNSRTINILASEGRGYAANGWHLLSDERLKENIEPMHNAMDKVKKLQGVTFDWKDKDTHPEGKQIGFIAQEVKDILPDLVSNDGQHYSLDYARMTSVLVEAIKEQQSEIEALREQNTSEIEFLKAQISELKAKLQ